MQMRMQLPILPRRPTRRDDAQLPPPQIQSRARQDLPVPFHDHPFIEGRGQRPDFPWQLPEEFPVNDGAPPSAPLPPLEPTGVALVGPVDERRSAPPLSRLV